MHPNPVFRTVTETRNIAFARDRGFGTLAINGPDAPLTAHIPFILSKDGKRVELHLVRSNPIARVLSTPTMTTLTILGPDSYMSPDWYGIDDQVPTWNYIAVRIQGEMWREPQEDLHAMLDRLSAHFETRLRPKPPWLTSKMSDGVMDKMMRMIQPFCIDVSTIEGTWKLGQNKPDDVRKRAADNARGAGIGAQADMLADMMRKAD